MNIIISGGSRGLGYALCEHFTKVANVCSFSRSEIEISLWKHLKINSLIPIPDEIKSILKDQDVLINNIGMVHDGLLATQGDVKILQQVEVNLNNTIILTKHWVRERMKIGKSGICVNISSIISLSGYKGLSVYSATKAGMNGFTKAMAREMGSEGFRFNAVLPGYFESKLSESMSEKHKDQIIRRTPLGRLANMQDIIPLVEFLISDSSKFVTGQLIAVDGGLSC